MTLATPLAGKAAQLDHGIEAAIDRVRVAHRLRPLEPSLKLTSAAIEHSAEMASRGYFSHDSANGQAMPDRLRLFFPAHGYRQWRVGENLLWSSPATDPAQVVTLWLASPEHRANLLDPRWVEVGCGAIHADSAPNVFSNLPVTAVTCDFGLRRR